MTFTGPEDSGLEGADAGALGSQTAFAGADEAETLEDLAARWPQFSVQELRRLRFLAYRRHTGRVRQATPVSVDVDRSCVALVRRLRRPTRPVAPSIAPGIPPLWAAWAEQQRARRRSAAT